MKDWDKEQMERYFNTTELLKQLNELPQTEKKNPQKKKSSMLKIKMKKNRKDEHVRRVLPIVRRVRNRFTHGR